MPISPVISFVLAPLAWAEEPVSPADKVGSAPKVPITVTLTEDVEARWYREDTRPEDYGEQVSRSNLLVARGPWTLLAQVDQVAVFSNTYVDDFGLETRSVDLLAPESPFPAEDFYATLEKLSLTGTWSRVEVTGGDFYTTVGRGIALNLSRNTDIDVDTSVAGARAVLRGTNGDVTLLTGFANPQQVQQDNRNSEIAPPYGHVVSALHGNLYTKRYLQLGAHGVAFTMARDYDTLPAFSRYAEAPDAAIAGATLGATGLPGGLDVYLEGNRLFAFDPVASDGEDAEDGWALYGSVAAYRGPVTLLIEGKRYYRMEGVNAIALRQGYELVTPPTLEYDRVITEDSSAAVNSTDIYGGRAQMLLSLQSGASIPSVTVGVFRDLAYADEVHFNRTPETIVHPVLGYQRMEPFGAGSHLFVNAGTRADLRDRGPVGEDYGRDLQAHADVDVHFPLAGTHSLGVTLAAERFLWGDNAVQQAPYTEVEGSIGWHVGAPLTVVAYLDYSDNPLIKGGANGSEGNLTPNLFGAGEIQWMPNPRTTVKAFYGAYKAGIRCAGGQCRKLPAFDGARLSLAFTL